MGRSVLSLFVGNLAILLLCLILKQASGEGIYQLQLHSFTNDLGELDDGECCSGTRDDASQPCDDTCKTFFRVCLFNYQAVISADPECIYGTVVTPVLGDNSFRIPSILVDSEIINPLRMPFDMRWPGTFSLVVEVFHDETGGFVVTDSARSQITRLATQEWLEVGDQWTYGWHNTSTKFLEYSYRVICDDFYYGPECADYCKARNDTHGHYTCDENGKKVCLEGWQLETNGDEYCLIPICAPGCHEEHGTCDSPGECKCSLGWTGEKCDQCMVHPECVNGFCEESFDCKCFSGWGGILCNQDLNYCTNHKPCENGATCYNEGDDLYKCECPPGFAGTNCEREIDDCLVNPCQNAGTCVDMGADSYQCECLPGYYGVHCETRADSCKDEPCQNGGTCDGDDVSFNCICPDGYEGVNCELEINECASEPCMNGGKCVDADNAYSCVCPSGYTGTRCDINIDNCSGHPCQNGGTCEDLENLFVCTCPSGFTGELCELNADDCVLSPCENGGTCRDLNDDYECLCVPGFVGKTCHEETDECESAPCLNGGQCVDKVDSYECECALEWVGENCEFSIYGTSPPPSASHSAPSTGSSTSSSQSGGVIMVLQEPTEATGLSGVALIAIAASAATLFLVLLLLAVCCVVVRCRKRGPAKGAEYRTEQGGMNNAKDFSSVKPKNTQPPTVSIKVCNELEPVPVAVKAEKLKAAKDYEQDLLVVAEKARQKSSEFVADLQQQQQRGGPGNEDGGENCKDSRCYTHSSELKESSYPFKSVNESPAHHKHQHHSPLITRIDNSTSKDRSTLYRDCILNRFRCSTKLLNTTCSTKKRSSPLCMHDPEPELSTPIFFMHEDGPQTTEV